MTKLTYQATILLQLEQHYFYIEKNNIKWVISPQPSI